VFKNTLWLEDVLREPLVVGAEVKGAARGCRLIHQALCNGLSLNQSSPLIHMTYSISPIRKYNRHVNTVP
jgi:hypothetical protein